MEGFQVQLQTRDGKVCGYTVVDLADAAWVQQWTWRLAICGGRPYARRSEKRDGKRITIYLHRALLGSAPDGNVCEIDHRDRDTLNNQRSNLRFATLAQNRQNTGARPGSSSSHRGVFWEARRQRWRVLSRLNGRKYHLGYFMSEDEAAKVASEWRIRHMPFAADSGGVDTHRPISVI